MSPNLSSPPAMAALLAIGLGLHALAAYAQPRSAEAPFNAIRRLPAWYGDRSLIEVEVVALPASGREAARRLRFRVERAYVTGLSRGPQPGNDLLGFGLDIPTGLPNALFVARLRGARSEAESPRVPRITLREQISRLLTLDLSSGELTEDLADTARRLAVCRGAEVAPSLYDFDYWRAPECRPFPGDDRFARFVALYGAQLLEFRCSPPQPGPPFLGCTLRFPFDGFAVRMAFDGSRLLRWSDLIDQAIRFLRSNQRRAGAT